MNAKKNKIDPNSIFEAVKKSLKPDNIAMRRPMRREEHPQ